MMNGHRPLSALSDDDLARLERLLTMADKTQRIDLDTIVAEMRANPVEPPEPALPLRQRPVASSAHEASCGRRYELTLYDPRDIGNNPGLWGAELEDRYQSEIARVEAMAAAGMSYAKAWDRIRRDCRRTTLADFGDLDLGDDDDEEGDPPRWRPKPNDGDAS